MSDAPENAPDPAERSPAPSPSDEGANRESLSTDSESERGKSERRSRPRISTMRRIWPLILVAGAVALIMYMGERRPVDVTAEYNLTGARQDLLTLSVSWIGDDGKTVDVRFNYHGEPPPRLESHQMELTPDDYTVRILLERSDGSSEVVNHQVTISSESVIELSAR